MDRRIPRKFIVGALGTFGLFAGRPSTSSDAAAAAYTMRLSLAQAQNSSAGVAALRFAAAVDRRSSGQLKIEVYPNGQLVKEQEAVDALVNGVIDFTAENSAFLEPLFPRLQVFDMPFLFKDINACFRVLDGPIGAELFAELESKSIVGLGWGISGAKEMETTTRAIAVPEDLKGLRMRISAGAIYAATYQALGAIPVSIDLSEITTALSQHTIDGLELPLANTFMALRLYNACKHVAMSNHTFAAIPLLGSKRKISMLPAALQKIVKEEGKAVVSFWRSLYLQETAASFDFLKQNGVAFTEIQFPAFRKAVEPVYAMLQSKLGGNIIERVSRAAGAN
jgi:TRAP-type transport system periplasmic protein